MRRCEIDKIGMDLPCMRRAPYFLKIASQHIGNKTKIKIYLCAEHCKTISNREMLTNLLDDPEKDSSTPTSKEYHATVRAKIIKND